MTTTTSATGRPWLVTSAVTVVVAIVLLAVPISYQRTTGHEVKLTLSGASLDPMGVAGIAKELKTALRAQSVVAAHESDGGAEGFTLTATVKGGSAADAQVVARTFAQSLEAKGYDAATEVRAIQEKVSDSMVAYARDNLIRIPIDNQSAAELEAEIRNQLAMAGIPDARVSVTDEVINGQPGRKLKVELDRANTAVAGGAGEIAPEPQIVLTRDGQPIPDNGQGVSMRVLKKKNEAGSVTTIIETTNRGQEYRVEIPNSDTMSETALAQAIEAELLNAGFRARVTMVGGRLDIEPLP